MRLRTVYPFPNARMLHSACIVGDLMVVIGGIGKEVENVWAFDTSMFKIIFL